MTAKYIDVESLVVGYSGHTPDDEFSKGVDFVLDLLDSKPPANVRPVVRCKDCRYSRKPDRHSLAENAACEGVLICFVGYDQVYPSSSNDVFVDGEHFCGYGEVSDG